MKQMDTTTKKIDSTTFYITPFAAFTSARISGELSGFISPLLGELAPMFSGSDDSKSGFDIENMDMEKLLPVLANALAKVDGDKFEHLAIELLVKHENITYLNEDGDVKKLTMDDANEIFCGDIMGMLMLGIEVVKVNFGGFFTKLLGQFGSLTDATGKVVGMVPGTKNGAN